MKNRQLVFYILFFLTGATSLIYEIAWQKYLASILGSDLKGTSIVVGIILGMIGLGYFFFGQLAKRISYKKNLKITALIELLIAISALLFPILFNFFTELLNNNGDLFFLEFLCCFILIGPASFLLGGNLPLITHYLIYKNKNKSEHFKLYTYNTLGAFFGCLIAAFVLLPEIGISSSVYLSSLINLLVAFFFLKASKEEQNDTVEKLNQNNSSNIYKFHLTLAFLTGVIAVCLQSILTRVLSISVGASEYSFAIVIAVYIISLSFGTKFLVSKYNLLLSNLLLLATIGASVIYFLIPQWPYFFYLLRINFEKSSQGFYLYNFFIICLFFILVLPVTIPLGAILPKLFSLNSTNENESNNGKITGLIYGFNSIGYMLGSFLLGYVILKFLNFMTIFRILVIVLATLCSYQIFIKNKKFHKSHLILLFLSILTFTYQWPLRNQAVGFFSIKEKYDFSYSGSNTLYNNLLRDAKVLAHKDGKTSSASVVEFQDDNSFNRTIMINAKPDGNTEGDSETMRVAAYVGSIFSKEDAKTAAIGYGAGLTSGALLEIPWIKNVDTIEISEEVIKFSSFFDFANNNASKNKKHKLINKDAYHYFQRTKNKYDLVISILTNFWVSGVEKLFTSEFYKHLANSLEKNGLFIQWISLSDISTSTCKVAINTFSSSFNSSYFLVFGKTLLMLGKNESFRIEDLEKADLKIKELKQKEEFNFMEVSKIDELLFNELWVSKNSNKTQVIQTIDKPKLSYKAGIDYYLAAKFNSEDIIDENLKTETLKNSLKSLNALWTEKNQHQISNSQLFQVLKNRCNIKNIKLIEPEWRYSRSICREVLIELMKANKTKIPSILKKDFDWLNKFKTKQLNPNSNTAASRLEISRFASFYSVFDRISLSELRNRIDNCYKQGDTKCQSMFERLKSDIAK